MSLLTEKSSLSGEESQEQILRGKLVESKRKLGPLIICDLLVCPALFAIILISLWIELNYPTISATGICFLLKHLNGTFMISSLLLWCAAHLCDMFLLLAITTDNVKYCRIYGGTLGPIIEILTLFFFSLMMWSSLRTLPNYTTAKFVIIVCSVIAILANFYNYLINSLAEHYQVLTRAKLMKYKMAQAV